MEKKKNPLIAKLLTGFIKGLPLIKTVKELIKPSNVTGIAIVDNKPTEVTVTRPRPNWKEILIEVITVALIASFVFGKITLQDLQAILALL